jgi:hypothetical protein
MVPDNAFSVDAFHGLGPPVFKIEVFNALQCDLALSKYTSLRTTLQNATTN